MTAKSVLLPAAFLLVLNVDRSMFVNSHDNKMYPNVSVNKLTRRVPDKVRDFISVMPVSSPNLMFDHLLESSRRDDSSKWSNIGFGEEMTQLASIEDNFTLFIWSSVTRRCHGPLTSQ